MFENELNKMTSKTNFKMEKYLICLNQNQRIAIYKFRTNNTCLPEVTGRFKKPKLERHKRFCTLCNENKPGL